MRYLEGDAVWESRAAGEWSADLMETARGYTTTPEMPLDQITGVGKDGDSKPGLILINYRCSFSAFDSQIPLDFCKKIEFYATKCNHSIERDGFKFAMLLIPNVIIPGRFFPSFSAIFNRSMQKLPLFSCILLRNEGKTDQT